MIRGEPSRIKNDSPPPPLRAPMNAPPHVAATQAIRAHFPALERHHNGFPIAYFDGPGGTQVPRRVGEAMIEYLYRHNANTHWDYPTSHETDEALQGARHAMADFLNAEPDNVAFGNNMTSLTFHCARALGRQWRAGDEIIVTDLDHHANIDPWKDLAAERGITVRSAPFHVDSGQLDWDRLEQLINERTRLVAIGAASNALGSINDVRRAARLARDAGALSFVDAVHSAPHLLPDVQAIGCDFLACSPYKFYGPHAGVLYGRKLLIEELAVPRLRPAPDSSPERIETGTQNHEGIIGAAAAVDFLASLADGATRRKRLEATYEALHVRASQQLTRLWRGLEGCDGVTLYGPGPDEARTPTLAFALRGRVCGAVSRLLARRGLFLSHGDFYAMTVMKRLGVEGLVRAGCACYTTDAEIDRLLEGVRRIAHGRDAS